ncbi:MAG: hypothetical protein ACE5GX_08885 [Thermoanaerobaculia bacterium]
MIDPTIPAREAQALREVGRTEIRPAVAALLVLAFLTTVSGVPLVQAIADLRAPEGSSIWPRLRPLAASLPRALGASKTSILDVNRRLQRAVDRFEERLEDESVARSRILPRAQRLLTGLFGIGSEQAYVGRDGWLFFREDFEHVTGKGFLEPKVLERARLDGERDADPIPAILQLRDDLARRGMRLVVVPTPVKPTVHPEYLDADSRGFIHNASFPDFVGRLESAGVSVFDPGPVLARLKRETRARLYLRTDTHWTPRAVDTVASALAELVTDLVQWTSPPIQFRRRSASVQGRGDTAAMLGLRDPSVLYPPERVEVATVLLPTGTTWKPSPGAEVLILGDSFTNVYSDGDLGWGTAAGLAEQLSFHLGRPVDRIAFNAGGASVSRRAFLAVQPARLEPKKLLIYQFAARELSDGDWTVLPLPAADR